MPPTDSGTSGRLSVVRLRISLPPAGNALPEEPPEDAPVADR